VAAAEGAEEGAGIRAAEWAAVIQVLITKTPAAAGGNGGADMKKAVSRNTRSRLTLLALTFCPALVFAAPPSVVLQLKLLPRIDGIKTSEMGIPMEVRAGGDELFVVPIRATNVFFKLDLGSGRTTRITVVAPSALTHLSLESVERLGANAWVASAGWVENGASRNGLLFFGNDGKVERYVGYGIGIRSLAVSVDGSLLAAAVQEPLDPLSTDVEAPTKNTLAFFDLQGKLLSLESANSQNRYSKFDEMHRFHRYRKVYFIRNTALITYPESASRFPVPAVYVMGSGALSAALHSDLVKKAPRDYESGMVPFHVPKVVGVSPDTFRALNIVPVVLRDALNYLVVWVVVPPELLNRSTPNRDQGRVFLALYAPSGKEAETFSELPSGVRVSEVTSSPDGRAFVICYQDILREWSVAEVSSQ
jgi:hypothetical protein